MGTQFWWFFDAASAAVILIAVFLSGKKGFAKSIAVTIGWVVAMAAAFAVSGGAAGFFYGNAVKPSNVSAVENALRHSSITQKTKSYIEGLGYNVTVDEEKLSEIFSKSTETDVYAELYKYVNNINGRVVDDEAAFNDKINNGFAEIMESLLADELTSYEAEAAAEKIRTYGQSGFKSDLNVICGSDTRAAAELIEEQYTSGATSDIIRIFCFIIIVFVFMIIVSVIARKLSDGGAFSPAGDISDHVLGGILGAVEGIAVIFTAAAAVRALVILGSNEMMLFNSETIDKTIFFKHIYNLVLKL